MQYLVLSDEFRVFMVNIWLGNSAFRTFKNCINPRKINNLTGFLSIFVKT